MEMERRVAPEMRVKERKLEGYASIFLAEARIMDFVEVIMPGAFATSLRSNPDILALQDHDASRLLARTKSGTLRLGEDARGLAFELDVPETTVGRDVLALAERGDLGGMSFGFRVPKGGDSWEGNRRTLKAIDLIEISVVSSFPAYSKTTVNARDLRSACTPLWQLRRYKEGFL
ncbi:HK97 family phage prohead protease [Dongia sp.]|uniref:HK97 family phage prohead protease n=1 Tax=Dongia sp. TaxID=1977262 RepID=UPI0035AEDCE1